MKKVTSLLLSIVCVFFTLSLVCGPSFGMGPLPPKPNFENEPAANSFLADSPWPMTHRNSYCQASSPYPGPEAVALTTDRDFTLGLPGLITMAISGPYPDGSKVIWGSNTAYVFKADLALHYIDTLSKEDVSLGGLVSSDEALSGAYTLVDRDNIFYMPRFTKLYAFGDSVTGDRTSDIEIKRVFEIPANRLRDVNEKIVGLTMTYDGRLAFATSHGLVGVVTRAFDEVAYYSFGADAEISNSIACDEDGGIYVVTDEVMARVQWTGTELTTDQAKGGWTAPYETGEASGVRLGAGSGSTPTLMGTSADEDKFVVITDCQDVMNLVLFWRDEIPADWEQIPGTKDRRIAAQIPVTFGDPDATDTLSEQSVCVRGYGALVVNNQLKIPLNNAVISALVSGITVVAPYGLEKFEWDPATNTMVSAWANPDVSMPNGIPCMSQATNLIYDVGQDWLGGWTFEAVDWNTGRSVFSYRYGTSPIFNSVYAGTEIGPDSSLYSGTALGMVRMKP